MKINIIGFGARMALCLGFVLTAVSGAAAAVGRPPVKIPPTRELDQRFAKANESAPRRASSHRVSATVTSGGDTWEVIATPAGLMTPIATKKRGPVKIALHFPLAQPGDQAVVTLLSEGQLHLVQTPNKPSKVLVGVVGEDRTIRLNYKFGQGLHNQKIEAKVGLARAILNLHLHDGSDH